MRLLDRSPRGVEATVYGHTLLKYGKAAFDDLRQGIQEIEFLADPGVGEIRIGAPNPFPPRSCLPSSDVSRSSIPARTSTSIRRTSLRRCRS